MDLLCYSNYCHHLINLIPRILRNAMLFLNAFNEYAVKVLRFFK